MFRLNKRGFTLVEAVASIFIITLVLTSAISIIINIRNHTVAANEKILASEVGARIRDDLINDTTYAEMDAWMGSSDILVTSSTCVSSSAPFTCSLFTYTNGGDVYDTNVTLRFLAPTSESALYQVIHFEVIINYYSSRTIIIEGIIYE